MRELHDILNNSLISSTRGCERTMNKLDAFSSAKSTKPYPISNQKVSHAISRTTKGIHGK
jgi:hypothetical protein